MLLTLIEIKTHSSVSCGPRSCRITPWVLLLSELDRLGVASLYNTIEISVLGHYLPVSLLLNVEKYLTKLQLQLFQIAHLGEYLWPGIVLSGAWTLDTYSFCFFLRICRCFLCMLCFCFFLFPLPCPLVCRTFVCYLCGSMCPRTTIIVCLFVSSMLMMVFFHKHKGRRIDYHS